MFTTRRRRSPSGPAGAGLAGGVVLVALVAAAAAPPRAAAETRVGPEVATDAPAPHLPGGAQGPFAVSWDGTQFLVAWNDTRPGDGVPTAVYATRVAADGAVRDPNGILLGRASAGGAPAAAWSGSHHLVTWADGGVVLGVRVSPAGAVEDPDPIVVATSASAASQPQVAWNGSSFLVVWSNADAVRGARVADTGAVLDPDPVTVSTSAPSGRPALDWDGASHLVVWSAFDPTAVEPRPRAVRVSAGGLVQPGTVAIPRCTSRVSAVAWSGSSHLVVCLEDWRVTSSRVLYGARVGADGTLLDPDGLALGTYAEGVPAIAWDGAHHLVTYERLGYNVSEGLYGARVTADGVVEAPGYPPPPYSLPPPAQFPIQPYGGSRPAVASSGAVSLVAFGAAGVGAGGALVAASGQVVSASQFPLTMATNTQHRAAVAWDGETHLVVWSDNRRYLDDIVSMRFGADGVARESAARVTVPANSPWDYHALQAVAGGPSGFVVAWSGGLTRVTRDGAVAGTTSLPLSWVSSVAPAGSGFVLAGTLDRSVFRGPTDLLIRAVRVGADGSVACAPWDLAEGPGTIRDAAIASDGSSALAVWEDDERGIVARRVVGGLVPRLDPVLLVTTTATHGNEPRVVWDGSQYLVVWRDLRRGSAMLRDLYAARVSREGVLQDAAGIPLSTGAGAFVATVTSNGFVVWLDAGGATLSGARVCPCGLVQPLGILVATGIDALSAPAVSAGGPDHALLVYDRFDATPAIGARRVLARTVTADPCPAADVCPVPAADVSPVPAADVCPVPAALAAAPGSSGCSTGAGTAPLAVLGLAAIARARRRRRSGAEAPVAT